MGHRIAPIISDAIDPNATRHNVGPIRETRLWNVPRGGQKSVRFRAREFNYSGPLLRFAREEPGEVGGRAGQRRAAQLGNPRLHLGIDKGGIEFLVESLDNDGGRAGGARRPQTTPPPPTLAGKPPRLEAPPVPPKPAGTVP